MFDNPITPPAPVNPMAGTPTTATPPVQPTAPTPQVTTMPQAPTGQRPVEDIFSDLEAKSGPGPMPASPTVRTNAMPGAPKPPYSLGNLKYLLIGVGSLVVILIGGYLVYQMVLQPKATVVQEPMTPIVPHAKPPAQTASTTQPTVIDSTATSTLATSSLTATTSTLAVATTTALTASSTLDSDGDGLTDYQEINIYHTNPNSTDSDNDGYSDGQEVKNGYNPNGSGKLDIKAQVPK